MNIAAVESVQAVDMHIEADNSTNVDIFYLFLTMPFSIRSFTSIPCMALEDTYTDKWHKDVYRCSKDANNPSCKPCKAIHSLRMSLHIVDRSTTILEATEILHRPMD
jgi:hypothetical protein